MARILIAFLLISVGLPSRAQLPELPITPQFLFPVGVLCGGSSEGFQEGVVRGSYETVIHLRNPSADREIRIAKALIHSLPYQGGRPPGPVKQSTLAPGGAIAIECDELRQMRAAPMAASFRSGYLVVWSDGEIDVAATWSAGPRSGEMETLTNARIEGSELCPFTLGEPGTRSYADRVCLGFAWTCENPESLTIAIDGEERGEIPLDRTDDYLLSDGSSTFCASTTHLADGAHSLSATLACDVPRCTLERAFEVANTPFLLISVTADRKRYRGSDTVTITVVLSESVDTIEADFTLLDTGFEEDRLTIEETDTPGTYTIEYDIDGIDNTNPAGIYQVPLTFTDQGVTRRFQGLRIGYVGETDNLLEPTDLVPTSTVVGRFPTSGTSEVEITELETSDSLILPLTTVNVTGRIEAPFISGRPRAEVEAASRDYALIWREADLSPAGAYRLRPAMLDFACANDGEELCESGSFTVEFGFPTRSNEIAKQGPHARRLDVAIVDPAGGVSEIVSVELTVVVLSEEMYSGSPQSGGGQSEGGVVGGGVTFRLGEGLVDDTSSNLLTLILTWAGEDGPGAEVVPGEDGLPQTLTALDLNIGLHRAQANGHGGWFGNLGNAELLRKSNTCFSGVGLGQPSTDRWNCVCSDASSLNMEVIAYPPGSTLDEGGDGDGTFGAEYYIYDSCGSQQDTIATLTAYYCGIAEQQSFMIDANLSEEDEALDQNWGNSCPFGSNCLDPKTVPTGFNETGGFETGFDFNPTDCAERPVIAGHISYKAPINFALNDPSAAGEDLSDDDPARDQSWSFFDENLSETGWTDFDLPFTKIEVSLVDGSEAVVGESFTDEDGNFMLILDPNYAEGGESGLVRVEAVALSAGPYDYRVIEDLDDIDDVGTEDLHRTVLVNDFDPVANAGEPFDVSINAGPDDDDGKEAAAAFHILRNSVVSAQYILSLGSFVEPFTALYDRDLPLLNNRCESRGSFYSGTYAHLQSIDPAQVRFICPQGQMADDGTCNVPCIEDPDGATYEESRVDFTYNTHFHEYAHHAFGRLTTISPNRFDERGSASHFGNTSERTSLSEGIASAFGQVLATRHIYDMYGPGQPMNTTMIECTKDDIVDCDLQKIESVDWLTTRDKDDGALPRPGPDWQPQKDCPPGDPGCGCLLGGCNDDAFSCQLGYCIDNTGECTAGSQGCTEDGDCTDEEMIEIGGFCVLPVTYSDGWTWRVLWDLFDEGEDVQPEVSHWRTSQMSDAAPAVVDPYDVFGDVETFWRVILAATGKKAEDPVGNTETRPNLADLVTRFRCMLDDDGRNALDTYLEDVVEFPYHNPTACP